MKININSKEWWDNEFKENWTVGIDGRLQSTYYASLVIANLDNDILIDLQKGSILDYGCALGQSTNILSSIQGMNKNIIGYDFSSIAINEAKKLFPHISFTSNLNLENKFDNLYISNVLEHFRYPHSLLNELSTLINKNIIILVPYNQLPSQVHPYRFKEYEFQFNELSGFKELSEFKVIQEQIIDANNKILDGGQQILYVLQRK